MKTGTLGKNNTLLKQIRRAISQESLTADGLLAIEGPVLLTEALNCGVEIVNLFLSENTNYAPPEGVPVIRLTPDLFHSIKSTETAQGVIALVRPPLFSLDELINRNPNTIIVLCRVQDPGNAGTILRVADAFGAACVATPGTVSIYNSKLIRASSGSIFRVPSCWDTRLEQLAPRLQSAGYSILGAHPEGSSDIKFYPWKQPVAILVGNEAGGLDEQEKAVCDAFLRIRHNEAVQSLNAAMATSIVLYEATRSKFT